MPHQPLDPRLVRVPPDHLAKAVTLLHEIGVKPAARRLGVSKNALLSIVARGTCMPGTAALLRESLSGVES